MSYNLPWTKYSYVFTWLAPKDSCTLCSFLENPQKCSFQILTWTRSPSKFGCPAQTLTWRVLLPKCPHTAFSPRSVCRKQLNSSFSDWTWQTKSKPRIFFWPMSQARCSHDKEFTFKCRHPRVVHLKMFTPPGASHTWKPPDVLLQVFHTTAHCSHKENTRRCWRCERQAPTEELFAGRAEGAAPEGATRVAAGNAFLPDVREAYLESEKHNSSQKRIIFPREAYFWGQNSIFGVRKEYLVSEKHFWIQNSYLKLAQIILS